MAGASEWAEVSALPGILLTHANELEPKALGGEDGMVPGPVRNNMCFVVTSLSRRRWATRESCEELYCVRRHKEDWVKDQQLDVVGDRTSTSTMRVNQ